MPLVIPPGFAHVALEMRHDDDPDPWYITFGVECSEAPGDPEAIGDSAMRAFHHCFSYTLSSNIHVTGAQVTVGEDGEPIRAFVNSPFEMSGTAPDARLPQNCALLVRKNTALGGRRNRGRMFIPGILAEGVVSATGVISPAATSTYLTYCTTFFGELGSSVDDSPIGLPMVILHSSGISETPDPTPVSSVSIDNLISTQRRRLR